MMTKKYLLRIFINFLKKNKVYDVYLLRLKEEKCGIERSINFIVKYIKTQPDSLIMSAFPWMTSRGQEKSWGELHREWVLFLLRNGFIV
jgi:hypothetical protein